jgi:hypothetical protein
MTGAAGLTPGVTPRETESHDEFLANGAGDRNRTRNLLFTKQLLCQLSYAGVVSEG